MGFREARIPVKLNVQNKQCCVRVKWHIFQEARFLWLPGSVLCLCRMQFKFLKRERSCAKQMFVKSTLTSSSSLIWCVHWSSFGKVAFGLHRQTYFCCGCSRLLHNTHTFGWPLLQQGSLDPLVQIGRANHLSDFAGAASRCHQQTTLGQRRNINNLKKQWSL